MPCSVRAAPTLPAHVHCDIGHCGRSWTAGPCVHVAAHLHDPTGCVSPPALLVQKRVTCLTGWEPRAVHKCVRAGRGVSETSLGPRGSARWSLYHQLHRSQNGNNGTCKRLECEAQDTQPTGGGNAHCTCSSGGHVPTASAGTGGRFPRGRSTLRFPTQLVFNTVT